MHNDDFKELVFESIYAYKRKQYPDVPEYAIARMVKVDMERG